MSTEIEKWKAAREIAWRFTERSSHAEPLTEDIADAIEKAVEEVSAKHDTLVERSVLALAICEGEHVEESQLDCPMLVAVARQQAEIVRLKAELASKQCPICGGHPKCCSACCWQQADIDYIKAQLVEARVLLITQGAEKQKLQKLLMEAKELVQGSATVFADYARLHEAKDTPEGYHKAKANMRQAEHLREFLSKPEIKELQ